MNKIFTYADISVSAPKRLMFFIGLEAYFPEALNVLYIGGTRHKISKTQH